MVKIAYIVPTRALIQQVELDIRTIVKKNGLMARSILVIDWMRGYGSARIISDNIRWNKEHETDKMVPTIISDTMREIEEFARFRFLKYTTCYLDVLKFYFQ